jgi:hypothetical protein
MTTTRTLAAVALLSVLGTAAQAKIVANAVRPGTFAWYSTNTQHAIPLVPGYDVTSLTVKNSKSKSVDHVLTFSAQCTAYGDAGGWMDIDITVNGNAVSPTAGSSDAFCSVGATYSFTQWTRPSISVVIPLLPGDNVIQVLGRVNGGATAGQLGHTSLVVHD